MAPSVLKSCAYCALLVLPVMAGAQVLQAADLDRDGVPDQFEQAILEKFRPAFMISKDDCDVAPSEFRSGRNGPASLERNGTIYGQVFRPPSAPPGSAVLEIHYYHLWGQDCGRISHRLDAEYVALLVHAAEVARPASEWKATHWYAAAHENTVCDTSSFVKASVIGAEETGATVWVSWGKHASYFDPERCSQGCGLDRCVEFVALPAGKLINLGELGFPLNNAEWATSGTWKLGRKMPSLFTPGVVAGSETLGPFEPVLAERQLKEIQSVVFALGRSLDSAEVGPEQASAAISLAETKTRKALGSSLKKVGHSVRKAKKRFLQWAEKRGLR